MWTQEMKRRVQAALPITQGIATGHFAVPIDFWDDVVPKHSQQWDTLLRVLDPEIKTLERQRERLLKSLGKLLPSQEAGRALLKFDDTWGDYTQTETTAAFLLGVAIGERLCGKKGSVKGDHRVQEGGYGKKRARAA